ncbi:MAG TPA: oligosaccharide flippase family protein [Candidatus Binatia bacterium]|nr:oligosaccharide flippase family protein [Candidatus Binatia bacterium]
MTIDDWLIALYERVSGTAATPRSSAAIRRFGPYLGGMIVAKGLSTLGQLLIGRLLGPAEFGRVAVVLATANVVAVPLAGAWGTAFVRYAAAQPDSVWMPLLRWTAMMTLASSGIVAAVVVAAAPFLAVWLDLPPALVIAGGVLGVGMALWLLAKFACQGREDWGRFVAIELLWGLGLMLGCAAALRVAVPTWVYAVGLFWFAYLLGTLAAGKYLVAAFSQQWTHRDRPVVQFGQFALLTSLGNTIILYADRFVAQRALGFSEVGVYQVYSFVTVGVATLLVTLVNNFAFPLFAQGDLRAFARLFRTSFVRLSPLIVGVLYLAGLAQIGVTGFPLRLGLLAIATLSAVACILAAFSGNLVLSQGVVGGRVSARISGLSLLTFAIGAIPAVRLGGLFGLFALYTFIFTGMFWLYQRALDLLPLSASSLDATGRDGRGAC